MSALVEERTARARTIGTESRARLAEDLLAPLEQSPESSSATDAAWAQEVRRRVEEVKAGTAELAPAEEVYAETRSLHLR